MCFELRQWILSSVYHVEVHLELLTKQFFILVCLLPLKDEMCRVTDDKQYCVTTVPLFFKDLTFYMLNYELLYTI